MAYRVGRRLVASMEPCLFRHGKCDCCHCCTSRYDASMEPCLFRHGKEVERVGAPDADGERLQWSHVFSDMVSWLTLEK